MNIPAFSVDPRGQWSLRQAKKVLEIISPEAAKLGIEFVPVEITDMSMPHRRVILSARCIRHQQHIELDSVCDECRRLS